MSETTELTSQYAAQVTSDLERNLKEQERLHDEIGSLQAQLAALQHNHTILMNIQQALGVPALPADEPAAAVPAPRKRKALSGGARQKKAEKPTTPARKRADKKSTAKTTGTEPTLVDLVHAHLAGQSEPRSAAEIATALDQQHPERTVKTTVVRTTLEGLVARNQAQRARQGRSVFYTASDATKPAAPSGEAAQQPA
ncbi:hypothetical protein [Streptomyces sp. NPDC050534]|uniref:hypothetical protein n=1 Tax=Streptomyces sp. NPDC050534 TaxID=3365625 RepID=UPI0037895AB3